MPSWAYIAAAAVGSFFGAALDAVVYSEGGSMLFKIGLVAGPALVLLIARLKERSTAKGGSK